MIKHSYYIINIKNRYKPIVVYTKFSSYIKLIAWLQTQFYINLYKEQQLGYIYVTDSEHL